MSQFKTKHGDPIKIRVGDLVKSDWKIGRVAAVHETQIVFEDGSASGVGCRFMMLEASIVAVACEIADDWARRRKEGQEHTVTVYSESLLNDLARATEACALRREKMLLRDDDTVIGFYTKTD